MNTEYLKSARKIFSDYKRMAEKTMEQLSEKQLYWAPDKESNSIAIIAKHLWGNMRSRWTNFLTEDGEKPWRNRDTEFEMDWKGRDTLMQKWEEGWQIMFNTIDSLKETDLDKTVLTRDEQNTVLEAINRQIAHYASHIGQIVYLGKMMKQEDWHTLSIARGKSKEFNEKMMKK
jgi:hypothetical protein